MVLYKTMIKGNWWAVLIAVVVGLLVAAWYLGYYYAVPPNLDTSAPETTSLASGASSAKGVVQLEQPAAGTTIQSPLTVSGFVYGNNGTITIELAQKDSGVVVAKKTTAISGQADRITFAESLQFALPAVPQTGVITVTYTDKSGKGLDDTIAIPVAFPSDLGSGLE